MSVRGLSRTLFGLRVGPFPFHPRPVPVPGFAYGPRLHIARSNAELAQALAHGRWVFVPTMGALHAGHAALVRQASSLAVARGLAGAVVSVFVNPTQFNEKADFDRYPRMLDVDAAICQDAGATIIYAPRAEDIYPPGASIPVPTLPGVATRPGLEDAHRPGHFAGVCQVVARLFDLIQPAAAVFGEKDWQQLAVIRAMVEQERMDIEIIGAPTVREADGLAMSSRNRFLSPTDRDRAAALSQALCDACEAGTPDDAETVMRCTLEAHGITPEYAVVREAATLERPAPGATTRDTQWRALIAARVGSVRLIDNCGWPSPRA